MKEWGKGRNEEKDGERFPRYGWKIDKDREGKERDKEMNEGLGEECGRALHLNGAPAYPWFRRCQVRGSKGAGGRRPPTSM